MITKHLTILLAVLLGGMSSIFFLPKQLGFQPVGIEMGLPKMVGGWYGRDIDVTEKERQVLGPGTDFARKVYRNGRGYEITASIVLSGQDMNTSIHRPERCMPAQGLTVIDNRSTPIALPGRPPLRVTRLLSVQNQSEATGMPALYNLTNYWFVGHKDVTESHFTRAFYDARDRLVHGYSQRWAYITVSATLPPNPTNDPIIEKTVDDWMKEFIQQLLPKIQKTS